ncbi:MAG: poly-gamma-glutamate system protein [Synergistaceae bacterium]|nr:poly-gamma-glutamate system protein [Synergistaceae bacterium]
MPNARFNLAGTSVASLLLKQRSIRLIANWYPEYKAKRRLYILTFAMLILFIASMYASAPLTGEEERAVDKVRAMQASLWEWLNSPPVRAEAAKWAELTGWDDTDPAQNDPGRSGLIGVEWSEFTTTLGPLAAKQASAGPLWAAHILRWFDKAGVSKGDRVMIYASGSFPGFLASALAAAETRELRVELAVSLGSSTWGANRMEAPWPRMELQLRNSGLLKTRSRYYTPGGRGESGGNYSPLAMAVLEEAAAAAQVPFLKPNGLDEVIKRKTGEIREFRPKLLVIVGGSASVTGGSDDMLPAGLIKPPRGGGMGRGIAKAALDERIPVLHLLNVRELSRQVGLDSSSSSLNRILQAAGLICFFAALVTHRRWGWG